MKLLPSNPLARDITVVLVIKFVLITALWLVFFRMPDHGRAVDASAVEHALFDRAPASAPQPENSPASAHSNASTKGQP